MLAAPDAKAIGTSSMRDVVLYALAWVGGPNNLWLMVPLVSL